MMREPWPIGDTFVTASELFALPTISVGQSDDLKMERAGYRWWLARTGPDDGEPYPNRVTVEQLQDGHWRELASYAG